MWERGRLRAGQGDAAGPRGHVPGIRSLQPSAAAAGSLLGKTGNESTSQLSVQTRERGLSSGSPPPPPVLPPGPSSASSLISCPACSHSGWREARKGPTSALCTPMIELRNHYVLRGRRICPGSLTPLSYHRHPLIFGYQGNRLAHYSHPITQPVGLCCLVRPLNSLPPRGFEKKKHNSFSSPPAPSGNH